MSQAKTVTSVVVIGQMYANVEDEVTSDNDGGVDKTATGSKAGTLTTRTDNDTGTLTMETGHGITTGSIIDLYWADGSRYNVTVGTVSGNSVPIDLGSGDNLPVADTAITAKVVEVEDLVVVGDNVQFIAFYSQYAGRVTLRDNANAVLFSKLLEDGETYFWSVNSGITNPIAGDTVDNVALSVEGSTSSAMKVRLLYN